MGFIEDQKNQKGCVKKNPQAVAFGEFNSL